MITSIGLFFLSFLHNGTSKTIKQLFGFINWVSESQLMIVNNID